MEIQEGMNARKLREKKHGITFYLKSGNVLEILGGGVLRGYVKVRSGPKSHV